MGASSHGPLLWWFVTAGGVANGVDASSPLVGRAVGGGGGDRRGRRWLLVPLSTVEPIAVLQPVVT